jgi:putative flippase GtrA
MRHLPAAPLGQLLRRFAAVGCLASLVDVVVLVVLRQGLDLPVALADAIAVTLAAGLSYLLHRSVTIADDPYTRWVSQPRAFLAVTAIAGAIDVVLVTAAVSVLEAGTAGLIVIKVLVLGVAAVVRVSGYRLVLLTQMRRALAQPSRREPPPGEARLSVIVPAYEEEPRIAGTVEALRAALAPLGAGATEVIVVDDGSTDGTAAAASAAGAEVVRLPANRGKGGAVRAGMLAARGRTVAYTDADLAYPPEQLLLLVDRVEAGWDVVVGSRRHVDARTVVRTRRIRVLSGRAFNVLTALVLLGGHRDTQCGLKAFRSDVAGILFRKGCLDGFAFDVELFHMAERYRLSVVEVPVELAETSGTTVRVLVDAVKMVRDLLRVRRRAGRGGYDLTAEERRELGMSAPAGLDPAAG